jgi:hypothetical protein
VRVVEEVAGPRDGKLGWRSEMKTDRVAFSRGADAETPGLDIDAAIPEAGLCGSDGDVDGAGDVEGNPIVAGGGVGYVDGLAANCDCEAVDFSSCGTGAAWMREAAWTAIGSARTAIKSERSTGKKLDPSKRVGMKPL